MNKKFLKGIITIVILALLAFVFYSIYSNSNQKTKETGKVLCTVQTNTMEGNVVTEKFYKIPDRVITTNQTATELLIKLGLGDKIVGTAYKDNPILPSLKPEYDKLKVLSDKYPSKEQALAVNPDFIFGWSTAFSDKALGSVKSWNDRGVNVYVQKNTAPENRPYTVNNVFEDINNIGKIFNIQDKTTAYVNSLKDNLANIKSKTDTLKSKKTVLILEAPSNGLYRAYGDSDLAGNMVTLAGGVDLVKAPANISAEDIVKYNPDAIFLVTYGAKENAESTTELKDIFLNNPKLQTINAVKNKEVNLLPLTDIWAGGVRTVPTVDSLFNELYPNFK